MKNNLAYICSPYRGNILEKARNILYARHLTKLALQLGYTPITTHLYLTQVLNDNIPMQRRQGLKAGRDILNACDTIIIGARHAILGIKCSNFDNYNYAQIYCTATKQDQARIVLNEISKFINADADLLELFEIKDYKSEITAKITNATIRALGRDTKSIDGFRPYLGIVDEYHAHKDNQMYKLLKGGTRKLKQSLISVITTAGFNLNAPCYELYKYCRRVLRGIDVNDRQFIYIAQMDVNDDIWNPKNWIKCCP